MDDNERRELICAIQRLYQELSDETIAELEESNPDLIATCHRVGAWR